MPWRNSFIAMAIVRLAVSLMFVAGFPSSTFGSPATTQAEAQPNEQAYHRLLVLAEAYNSDGRTIDKWQMTTEHCFVVPALPGDSFTAEHVVPVLQDEVVSYVEHSGQPRFLFDRLLKGHADKNEVLSLAEFLMFVTYDNNAGDFNGSAGVAAKVLSAAETGTFLAAEKQYPDAPIRACIEAAARRAIARSTTKPAE